VEIKQIKELMSVMRRTGTKRLSIKKQEFELQLEMQETGKVIDTSIENDDVLLRHENTLQRASLAVSRNKELASSGALTPVKDQDVKEKEEAPGVFVTSPMVGTYYTTPSPDEPAFVKVGDKVEKHTVVCIIEAMKVMNEVKAGVSGTVAEIFVENGHPVEFGTKLFRII
jgi:acetyl-CoA carboxylase biotin carboxyl carrier protein